MSADRKIFKYIRSIRENSEESIWRIRNGDRHFPTKPWCPYCNETIKVVYQNSRELESPPGDNAWWRDEETICIYSCNMCGWWYMASRDDHEDNDSDDFRWYSTDYQRALLEVHNLSIPEVPIDALSKELLKRGDDIIHIHHRVMESLVAGVMREYYPGCEVEMCGRSGDGGIDLYIVRADKTIAVQVKRRMTSNSVERVSTVRDFFGAGVAKKFRDLIFVSTAKRFTGSVNGASEFARKVVDDKIIDSFKLIDRERFLGMLELMAHKPIEEPWRKYIW